MTISIYEATAGAQLQQIRMEIIANNLANINTAGFKEDKAVFHAYLPAEPVTASTREVATEETVVQKPSEGATTEGSEAVHELVSTFPGDYVVSLERVSI